MEGSVSSIPADKMIVLYDGVCGLCNRSVQFLLKRDTDDRFRFAPLQSPLGRELVLRHGGDPEELSTFYLVERAGTDDERASTRGVAALRAAIALGGGYKLLGVFRILPGFVLNLGYRVIAGLRYRIWGKLEACPVPSAADRAKFLATGPS